MVVIGSSIQVALGAKLLNSDFDLRNIYALEHPCNEVDVDAIGMVVSLARDNTHDLARNRVEALVLVEDVLLVGARVCVDVVGLRLSAVDALCGTSVGLRRLGSASELQVRVDGFETVEHDFVVVDDGSHVARRDGASVLERLQGAEHSYVDVLAVPIGCE